MFRKLVPDIRSAGKETGAVATVQVTFAGSSLGMTVSDYGGEGMVRVSFSLHCS